MSRPFMRELVPLIGTLVLLASAWRGDDIGVVFLCGVLVGIAVLPTMMRWLEALVARRRA